jgi:mannan polymerase II complex MNN10 subunit
MMSMAGCEWGRDCWGEMYTYRELSNKLNRTYWEKFKDGLSDGFKWIKRRVWDSPKPEAEEKKVS